MKEELAFVEQIIILIILHREYKNIWTNIYDSYSSLNYICISTILISHILKTFYKKTMKISSELVYMKQVVLLNVLFQVQTFKMNTKISDI